MSPNKKSPPRARGRSRRITLLEFTLVAAAFAGLLCCPRLWLSSHRLFPMTPVWQWLPQPPYPLDYILFGLALASLAGVGIFFRRPVFFIKSFLALAAVLALLDQSRWQPWLVGYAAMLGALLLLPWDRPAEWDEQTTANVLHPCRLLMICTYFYSGFQKLNYGFVVVLGLMLEPMFDRLHLNPAWLAPRTLGPAAMLLALVECLSGAMLAFPRTRRLAVGCMILMHTTLLLWLGPLALRWNYVIWPWNLAMIALLVILFTGKARWDLRTLWRSHTYAKVIGVAFGILPLLTLFGAWDAYLGFSLYSGNIKDAMVYVDPKRAAELPAEVRPYVKPDGMMEIDRWSNQELGVPIYPETRIFASVGRQVANWLGPHATVRVIEIDKPNRFTGERKATQFDPLTY
ncbi:MAG: hypothetical protein HY236_11935 [Acidobacteria bacterium]|nr:hypothetical protein [Acidobacteriota bacterium]